MNDTNQHPAEAKQEMTPEEISAAQKKGRLIYRPVPYQAGEETHLKTSDNTTYRLEGKTLRRLKPRERISKKARLQRRRQLAGGREVVPHVSGSGHQIFEKGV